MLIVRPDDLVTAALKRMRAEPDGQRVLRWLQANVEAFDQQNRVMIDAVQLRQGQGAASTLAEIIAVAEGKASMGALTDTRKSRAGQGKSDTGV